MMYHCCCGSEDCKTSLFISPRNTMYQVSGEDSAMLALDTGYEQVEVFLTEVQLVGMRDEINGILETMRER